MKTERITGAPISIVKPERFEDFMNDIASDTEMPPELLLFLVISLSGALRVSEALSLRKTDFKLQPEGDYFVTVDVLKKKKDTKREIALPAFFTPYITGALLNKRTFDYVFIERVGPGRVRKFTRHDLRYRLEKYFGIKNLCLHSMRHSCISFLTCGQPKQTAIAVSSLLKVSLSIVSRYSHANGGEKFRSIYNKKAV